jgi:hypothetical protein
MTIAFANPLLLVALVAAGLPVLIHFLTRARPREIRYPTFHLLREAAAGQQALHQLRTWLLLALRTLAILGIVLWFTRPFLRQADVRAAVAQQRVVIVIDASLSMRAVTPQRVTLFARAQAEAAEVLRGLPAGSAAGIVLAGAQPRPLLPALTQNLDALHDEMIRAHPTYERGEPMAALALARRLLGGNGTIYVFSDFLRTNWEDVRFDGLAGPAIRLRQVATSMPDNVGITAVKVRGDQVIATIFNSTARPRQETVRLEINGATQEASVNLPPFSARDATFAFDGTDAELTGKLTLAMTDDLVEDNIRYFHVRAGAGQRVLLLSDAEPHDRHSTAFYLAAALGAGSRFQVDRRLASDADRRALEAADVFMLATPATLTADAIDIMARRVREGARLVCWLDGPTAPALVDSLATLSTAVRLTQTVTGDATLTSDTLASGPLRAFADPQQAELSGLHFGRHFQSEVRSGDVLLHFANGDAALVHDGGTLWVNLPLTPDGSDFAGSPLFPALLHESLRVVQGTREEPPAMPGQPWQIPVPSPTGTLVVTGPDGRDWPSTVLPTGVALPAAELPGHYVVKRGQDMLAIGVVNVDPRESDLRPVALPELARSASNNVAVITVADGRPLTQPIRPLWPALATGSAVFVAVEMAILALWTGRGPRR